MKLRLFHPGNKLRTFNNLLSLVVAGLGLYLIMTPFLPNIDLAISQIQDDTAGVRYVGALAEQNDVDENLAEAPKDNRLVIPGIQLDEPIVVGSDPANLNKGVWQRPLTSTPDKGGNTVLVGHRFTYSSPATFYHLDKMKVGESFAVWREGREYVYEVFNTVVVPATAIEIEDNTDDPIMTLYTCTPLWTARDRLVIQARLVNEAVLRDVMEVQI